jgi:hypothetical protein
MFSTRNSKVMVASLSQFNANSLNLFKDGVWAGVLALGIGRFGAAVLAFVNACAAALGYALLRDITGNLNILLGLRDCLVHIATATFACEKPKRSER